jgi:ribosomal protein L21
LRLLFSFARNYSYYRILFIHLLASWDFGQPLLQTTVSAEASNEGRKRKQTVQKKKKKKKKKKASLGISQFSGGCHLVLC